MKKGDLLLLEIYSIHKIPSPSICIILRIVWWWCHVLSVEKAQCRGPYQQHYIKPSSARRYLDKISSLFTTRQRRRVHSWQQNSILLLATSIPTRHLIFCWSDLMLKSDQKIRYEFELRSKTSNMVAFDRSLTNIPIELHTKYLSNFHIKYISDPDQFVWSGYSC
jgi:hypothetical protein